MSKIISAEEARQRVLSSKNHKNSEAAEKALKMINSRINVACEKGECEIYIEIEDSEVRKIVEKELLAAMYVLGNRKSDSPIIHISWPLLGR